jgi:hypothetical protein
VFVKLQNKLPKSEPRRDLFANTFDACQNVALVLKANEQGKGGRPDATFAAAGIRKHLLTRILEGNMTPEEKTVYTHGERVWKSIRDSVQYWEIIADNLSKAGWSWCCSSQIDSTGRVLFTADAQSRGRKAIYR